MNNPERELTLEEAQELRGIEEKRRNFLEQAEVLEEAAQAIREKAANRAMWPKRLKVAVTGEEWDAAVMAFVRDRCGFDKDKQSRFKTIGHEAALYFDVYEDGSYKCVGAFVPDLQHGAFHSVIGDVRNHFIHRESLKELSDSEELKKPKNTGYKINIKSKPALQGSVVYVESEKE